MNFTNTHSYCR